MLNSLPLLPSQSFDEIYLCPTPLEVLPGHILKVPIPELHQTTYILIKHICGLHISSNRITIQTSVPCQGMSHHCMFLVSSIHKKAIVDFILMLIQQNQDADL